MSCKFELHIKGNPEIYLAQAKAAIEKFKGTLTGDAECGELFVSTPIGKIKASYLIKEGNTMQVEVHEKPLFLSCDKIKTVLQEYIG